MSSYVEVRCHRPRETLMANLLNMQHTVSKCFAKLCICNFELKNERRDLTEFRVNNDELKVTVESDLFPNAYGSLKFE